jgi:hypothetical protein
MSLPAPGLWLFAFFVPLAVVIIVGKVRLRRQADELERNGGVEPAFAPAGPPPPSFLLQRFSLPERTYLLRYKPIVRLITGAYAFLVILSSGMLPASIREFGLLGGGPQSIWHSYLSGIMMPSIYIFLAVLSGMLASVEISMGATANFARTRPISRRLIYWGRIAPSFFTLLGTFALAAVLSFAILVICYGPVYRHLLDAALRSHVALDPDAAKDLALLLRTSVAGLFLSIATTLMLGFSITVATLALPLPMGRYRVASIFLLWIGVLGYQMAAIFMNGTNYGLSRFFFLYSHLGPPPPYVYALVPITLSAVLLLIAGFLSDRLET